MPSRVRENPSYDVGVHLTFTCEYPEFRWPAVSTRDPASGLLDGEGYLWNTREDAVRHVLAEAGELEMRAQIELALEAGIEITHIDTHMGSVVHPKFLKDYYHWRTNTACLRFYRISLATACGS